MSKTIKVADILERTNHILSLSNISQNEKKALIMMLSSILHTTDNYCGFCYTFDFTTADEETRKNHEFDRKYFVSKELQEDYETYVSQRKIKDGLR